jgi:hypothetical protein
VGRDQTEGLSQTGLKVFWAVNLSLHLTLGHLDGKRVNLSSSAHNPGANPTPIEPSAPLPVH